MELSCVVDGEGSWAAGQGWREVRKGKGAAMFCLTADSELAELSRAGAGDGRCQSRPTYPGHTA